VKIKYLLLITLTLQLSIFASVKVKEIDFLSKKGLDYNGLGPLLVRTDIIRGKIIQVNTISSSVTIIDEKSGTVTNIPVEKRVPQFLKEEALCIDSVSGNIYSIADKSLNIVFPDDRRSVTVDTKYQFEMVAVDSLSGNCLLVGKTSKNIAYIDVTRRRVKFKKIFKTKEKIKNLNQTPPPPLRKVVFDKKLNRFFIYDGYSKTLFTIDGQRLKIISKRVLEVKKGTRLHFAGYDDNRHFLYLVIETEKRKDVQAVRIDCNGKRDIKIDLPGLREAVGVKLNIDDEQVYIPYDNHPVVHVVDFSKGKFIKVDLPSYGNDASAFDVSLKKLFIASWAYGEIYVVDLKTNKLIKRVRNIGIIPHMFNIAYSPVSNKLYIPLGASAVNGTFGSALTVLDIKTYKQDKIETGWGPIAISELKNNNSYLVFNSEDEFAKISVDKEPEFIKLPFLYPTSLAKSKNGNMFLSYGPHQSYWPVVYIWGAKNGVCEIEWKNLQIYDRRISRLAQKIVVDKRGGLWGTQNSWGREKIFMSYFPDGIRQFAPQKRVYFYKNIERENSPRVLKYDKKTDLIFMAKTGEKDSENGLLLIINPKDEKLVASIKTGPFPTDIEFDKERVYISDFTTGYITVVDRKNFTSDTIKTGKGPLKMAVCGDNLFVINHIDNSLMKYGKQSEFYKIPFKGHPDNIISNASHLYITSHDHDLLTFFRFDTEEENFKKIFEYSYPYGETSFDSCNSAFYLKGQFADSIYEISKIVVGSDGKIIISDFLSGKLFMLSPDKS